MRSGSTRIPTTERINFEFSWDGTRAACLAADERLQVQIHQWSFDEENTRSHHVPLREDLGAPSYVMPLDDGRVIFCYSAPGLVHTFVLTDGMDEVPLGGIRCDKLRIRPCPDRTSALVTARTGASDGAMWRIDAGTSCVEKVCDVPGLQLLSGGWMDAGRRYALNQRRSDGLIRPAAVDLSRGFVTPVPAPDGDHNEILQLVSPARNLLLTASDATGDFRLVLDHLSTGERVIPHGLDRIEGSIFPLAFDDSGRRILLQISHGIRHDLVLYDLGSEEVTEIPMPLGGLCGPVRFTDRGLRMAYSTPEQPADIIDVDLRRASSAGTRPSSSTRTRLEQFAGPAGSIEAVVYGEGDWRDSRHVLIALHGGPEHHWSPRFDALFAGLALAGVTVIAPNQRGSTRYGQAHQEAIRGSWGGPDLEDICHLAETITAQRRDSGSQLSLYGISYGAYLALLAASVQPHLWSRCVVIAPFLSGPRLYAEAGPKVRLLLERLDGLTEIHDAIGPRDLFRLAPRISAGLLVIHGDQDIVVPVTQSRALRDRLTAAGRRDGVDFVYKEIPGEGHNPLHDLDGQPIREVISRFLFTHSAEGR